MKKNTLVVLFLLLFSSVVSSQSNVFVPYSEFLKIRNVVNSAGFNQDTTGVNAENWEIFIQNHQSATSPGSCPIDATYVTKTPNSILTQEQALSLLATGILKNNTGTGTLTIATAGVDYVAVEIGDISGVTVGAPLNGGGNSGAITVGADTSDGNPHLSTQFHVQKSIHDSLGNYTTNSLLDTSKIDTSQYGKFVRDHQNNGGGGAGDITAVTAVAPLSGGGVSGDVSVSADTSDGNPHLSTQFHVQKSIHDSLGNYTTNSLLDTSKIDTSQYGKFVRDHQNNAAGGSAPGDQVIEINPGDNLATIISGITDETTNKRYVLRINPGMYQLTASLQMTDWISLVGVDKFSCIIYCESVDNMILIDSNLRIANLTLKTTAQTTDDINLISSGASIVITNFILEDCILEVDNDTWDGQPFRLGPSSTLGAGSVIRRCEFRGTTAPTVGDGEGMWVDYFNSSSWYKIEDCTFKNFEGGIYFVNAEFPNSTLISGCIFDNCDAYAIQYRITYATTAYAYTYNNSVFRIGADGFKADVYGTGGVINWYSGNDSYNNDINVVNPTGTLNLHNYDTTGEITGQYYATINVLTDGEPVAIDWNNSNVQSITLGGNRTISFSNQKSGAVYTLMVIQDATGSRVPVWSGNWKWPGGVTPVLTTTANAVDVLTFVSNGTNLYCIGFASDVK